jgi:hypothetical protein
MHHTANDVQWASTTTHLGIEHVKRLVGTAWARTAATTWAKTMTTQRYPTGTVLWNEPSPTSRGDRADSITHGSYWYTTTSTTTNGLYRTADSNGQRKDDLSGDQISAMAVHTKDAEMCKHDTKPHIHVQSSDTP